jgi:hypothetical protein
MLLIHAESEYSLPFSRVKQLGHGNDHPPTFRSEVKERIKSYFYYSPTGPSRTVLE